MNERLKVPFRFLGITLLFMASIFLNYAIAAIQAEHVFHNDNMREFVANYSDALLVLACLFLLVAGTIASFFYPNPQHEVQPYPKRIKALISVTGGLLSFLYYFEENELLSPAVCIYVAGITFVSPAIVHLIHAAAIEIAELLIHVVTSKFTGLKIFMDDKDLDRRRFHKTESSDNNQVNNANAEQKTTDQKAKNED